MNTDNTKNLILSKYKITLFALLVALALVAAAHFGVYEVIRNDMAVQVVNVDTGCMMNYVPEPDVWRVTNRRGEQVYIGPEEKAVQVFRFECR